MLTLDPLAAMAETDAEQMRALLATVTTDSEGVAALLERLAGEESSCRRAIFSNRKFAQFAHARNQVSVTL